ncbi:MAG: 50S ribosomal protein L3 [Planctomycetes bacterium DG_58]|nr:MAG: 50S ribosomal protein L3 [Planctomycetes bacterium DG_58]KPL04684.1 MAG: 50S ribosomal protein L3 [Planctomycetes bacterium SM23_65]
MLDGMLGKKIGMSQVYDGEGNLHPITVIQLGPCTVMQVKTDETDGYSALQLGFEDKPRRVATRPERRRAERADTEPKRFVREVRVPQLSEDHKAGRVLTAAEFEGASVVNVQGVTKGKGFAGVVRRWGFRGAPGSHGTSKVHRRPGSIGAGASPSKVIKGLKMGGRSGGTRRTVKNLKVLKLDPDKNLLMVGGSVPGPVGGFLFVRVAKREVGK